MNTKSSGQVSGILDEVTDTLINQGAGAGASEDVADGLNILGANETSACTSWQEKGRRLAKSGTPLPPSEDVPINAKAYQCYADGYNSVDQDEGSSAVWIGLGIVGVLGGLWLAKSNKWI